MTKLTLWNSTDLDLASQGRMRPDHVRTIELDALADSNVTVLTVPIDLCRQLGLRPIRKDREGTYMGGLRISIFGRDMACDALAAPVGTTPRIGRIPLLGLDLVLDPDSQELIPNPAHPDGPVVYA